ncbi:hypothetical protein COY16_02545 [Candidatus Roizmanbacteria bacterium CG_4_10_14_0_2_um_filter_39_13]|uniref:Glycosyltransferase n=1 Tax=Candidatus Roizmanbacteria bacterium CG_4_10_14_0_2_um_filter_39_13 TaxID=1974825 RepID=A0A2M7TZH5_9BACT|nr:MAG: hypothetical protein COY16_02545 [Candidatus Roizmanbacteria bacterium CG_4_10_14_0_2_um_filter_39_13]
MDNQKLLGTTIKNQSKEHILEKIQKYLHKPYAFFHIVSLNPENIMLAKTDQEFQNILSQGDIQLIDGVGVALGCAFLNIDRGERMTGADFMEIMLKNIKKEGLRVVLLGGQANLAKELADCYHRKYPEISFLGEEGFEDVRNPSKEEIDHIFEVIADYKPQIVFAAFGSPDQEKFFARHKREFAGIICMGVGGGFDFAAGKISRAPVLIRRMGLEWLYRLILQPWRWRRQIRLIQFMREVLKQKLKQ